MLGRALDPEEVDLRAEPEHDVVVAERLELVELDAARVQVDPRHPVLVDAHVVLFVEEVADRMAHRRLFQKARRNLVQQRLERVVVVLVHDHDVGVALLQLVRGADPGEATAEDEDARAPTVWV